MTGPRFHLIVTGRAELDIAAMLDWGEEQFGQSAVVRYEALLEQAFVDLSNDPERPGATARPDLGVDSFYSYHLQFSRNRTEGVKVKRPRHMIVYFLQASTITVVRILRDNCDLRRHVPQQSDFD